MSRQLERAEVPTGELYEKIAFFKAVCEAWFWVLLLGGLSWCVLTLAQEVLEKCLIVKELLMRLGW